MARRNEDASIKFECIGPCDDSRRDAVRAGDADDSTEATTWDVEGRFNAEGEFEPHDEDDLACPDCGGDDWAPFDSDVVVAR